jgi:hypothetical protein
MNLFRRGPQFSIRNIPFSHYGSWFNFSPVLAEGTFSDDIHLVSHQNGRHPVLRLTPGQADAPALTAVTATPALLTWTGRDGTIELTYATADTVRVRGRGLPMLIGAAQPTLTPFSGPYLFRDPVGGAHVYTLYETGRRYRITVLAGSLSSVTGAEQLGTARRDLTVGRPAEGWEIAIEEFDTARTPYRPDGTFEEVAARSRAEFESFVDSVAPWRDDDTPAAELAAYVVWSATVRPAGFLTRPAVLMSMHWMNKVWSWDHCFNALALADGAPELSWDQYQIVFAHQDASGALPDSITHSEVLYNFVKPPIHGWTLRQLRHRIHRLTEDDIATSYRQLERWTGFWLTQRRVADSGLPHYQHGNDSGWDNATTFDRERVVEAPDLAAFLVLQMRELAELADLRGEPDRARAWAREADELRTTLLQHLWSGDRFVARAPRSGHVWSSGSLLHVMPIVLGEELPATVGDVLAGRIRQHLTPHGLATELPSSPLYSADGYWRGPIWAPATVLIEDGLRRAGHVDLASDISRRFRALCERSGFAENFDALTGAGLRDRAYTWTASAYLHLCAAHRRRGRTERIVSRPTVPADIDIDQRTVLG